MQLTASFLYKSLILHFILILAVQANMKTYNEATGKWEKRGNSLSNSDLGAYSPEFHEAIEVREDRRIIYSKQVPWETVDKIQKNWESIFKFFEDYNYIVELTSQYGEKQKVVMYETYYCNGIWVDETYFLTAKHCFDSFMSQGWVHHKDGSSYNISASLIVPWYNFNFMLESLLERLGLIKIRGEPWYYTDSILLPITGVPNYEKRIMSNKDSPNVGDIVLLYGRVHWTYSPNYKFRGLDFLNERELHTAFGTKGSYYISVGQITYINDEYICYDAPTYPGSAGGPVIDFTQNENLDPEFVAMHVKGSGKFKESCGVRRKIIKRSDLEKDLWYLPILWDVLIILNMLYWYKKAPGDGKYGVILVFAICIYLFGCFLPDLFGV